MSLSNYTRSARTASKAEVSTARAPQKEISFAEVVSAQARGEGAK